MKIEAILKNKRHSRQKKRKGDEDVLDRAADEEVSRLRERMLIAAQNDDDANKEKMPATSKLRLLPEVMEVLRKYVFLILGSRIVLTALVGLAFRSPLLITTCSRVSDDG